MNQYNNNMAPITNKVMVSNLQEALNRVFMPSADCVFYCPSEDCYYNIMTDNLGNKKYDKYVKSVEKEVVFATKDDIEELRRLIGDVQQQSNTKHDDAGATSTNQQ